MMEVKQPVFACDKEGCRSRCTLDGPDAKTPEAIDKALVARGWAVKGANHYCPAHKLTGR